MGGHGAGHSIGLQAPISIGLQALRSAGKHGLWLDEEGHPVLWVSHALMGESYMDG